jgi:hypothetical protein
MQQQKKPFQKLLVKNMSRREFLGFIGAATLGVVGITGLVRGIQDVTGSKVNQGYGSSAYGGGRDSSKSRSV